MDDGTESGDLAGLSDELLRDAFLANDDPELTLCVPSMGAVLVGFKSPV